MVTDSSDKPRACGLYRTTIELAEHPGRVAADLLVYFHNHSEQGSPIVVLPESNHHNKWRFGTKGYSIDDTSYIASLQPLAREGLYRLREHFHPDDTRVVGANSIVQLGYDRTGAPIVFFPARLDDENVLVFPNQGMRIPPTVYRLLEPLDVRGPQVTNKLH